jgi:hypothetical protein
VVVTNTGYRLLRSRLRVEPPGTAWLEIAPELKDRPFTTAEETEIPLDVEIPESMVGPMSCTLVIESNGGSRRVEVRIEPPPAPVDPAGTVPDVETKAPRSRRWLAGMPLGERLALGAVVICLLRLALIVGDGLAAAGGFDAGARPSLPGAAALLGLIGGATAARFAAKRGVTRDLAPAAIAGMIAGVLAAAVAVAAFRTIEAITGPRMAFLTIWGILGVLMVWGPGLALLHRAVRRNP